MTQQQWRVFELVLQTGKNYVNPFLDVDVTAAFTGPDGEALNILAFWDGEGTWRVRVALTAIGEWHYSTSATDGNPDFVSEGSVTCVPYEGELDIYKHGFLKMGPQNRYFTYADGTPFFWLGDTHWTFVTEERWDESNCPKYDSQFRACVDKRVQQKFTVYESNFRDGPSDFWLFGRYDEYLVQTEHGFLPNIPFLQSNPDPKMQYIADVGLVNAVGFSWNDAIHAGGTERYVLLAKYLVARYGAYPVLWTLGGEVPGYGFSGKDSTGAWREVALETEKWDTYQHLMTFHQAAARPFLDLYAGESWYDFALTQGAHGDFAFYDTMYSEFREKHPAIPLVEGEVLYEGATSNEQFTRVITPEMMRYVAWTCFQTGGCGYTYGCNGVWELQWEAGVGGIGWGDMAWWDGLELPGANQLTLMREFYEAHNWWKLKPIQGLVSSFGFGGGKGYMATADDEMRTVVVYFSLKASKLCSIKGLSAKSYTAQWFNPETGEYTLIDADARPVNNAWSTPMPARGKGFSRVIHDQVLVLTAN